MIDSAIAGKADAQFAGARYYRPMNVGASSLSSVRLLLATACLGILLASCAQVRTLPPEGQVPANPSAPVERTAHFQARTDFDAARIAELRAAPPVAQAEITEGTSPAGDERILAAKGFVRVGNGYFPGSSSAAQAWAQEQAKRIGADRVVMYTPPASTSSVGSVDATAAFESVFYVRFRLPFGASFRDLNADEKQLLGVAGGVEIGSVVGGTPASEANLRSGDFVLKFNGKALANRAAFQELLRLNMGKRVTLTVTREDATFDRLVRLGVLASELGPAK